MRNKLHETFCRNSKISHFLGIKSKIYHCSCWRAILKDMKNQISNLVYENQNLQMSVDQLEMQNSQQDMTLSNLEMSNQQLENESSQLQRDVSDLNVSHLMNKKA